MSDYKQVGRIQKLVAGTNITLDPVSGEGGDVTINASGGGTPAVSVTDETTYGITPAVGTGTNYARQDHTHGTMATPTKTTVGLGNVDNTADTAKPVKVYSGTWVTKPAKRWSGSAWITTPY